MRQLAVWMDHNEARVFHLDSETFDETTVESPNHHIPRHPEDMDTRTRNHPDDDNRFFHAVAATLAGADSVLLVGPSVTKLHFLRYVQKHVPALDPVIVGIETADHPTDRQFVAHVRQYYHKALPRLGTAP